MRARWAAWAAAAALLGQAAPAAAVDFFGYFRDSIAGNNKGGAQACFKTPGMDYKLRLGNECDNYGEWGLQQSIWKGKDGTEFTVGVMFSYDPNVMLSSGTGTPFGVQQNYIKAKFPGLHGAQFWAGKQYYRRENIDMIDFFYLNTSEPGVGVEDWDLGFAKLAASVFATQGAAPGDFTQAFWRPDVRIYGIPLFENATLELDANLIVYSRNRLHPKGPNDSKTSVWVTGEWTQDKLLGGSNKLAVQWANGAAAQMGPGTPSFGTDPVNKDNQQFRVVEQLLLQPSLKFQTLIGAVYQWKRQFGPTGKFKTNQIGVFGRPVYYLTNYFKLQGDIGWTRNDPDNGSAMDLFKFCFAPTLTPPPGESGGFFVRPEIRLFITYATWNRAAANAVDATHTPPVSIAPGAPLFGTDKNGFTYGASVETWF